MQEEKSIKMEISRRISASMEKWDTGPPHGRQTRFSSASGVKVQTLNNYLKGRQSPSAIELHKIARALDVSMEWLLTGSEPGTATAGAGDLWRNRASEAEAKLKLVKDDLQAVLKKI